MSLTHSPKIVTENLVLCLDAANPKSYPGSGTTWFDISGNNNNATQQGNTSLSTYTSNGYFEHRPLDSWGAANTSVSGDPTRGCFWQINHSDSLNPSAGFWTVVGWLRIVGTQSHNGSGWFHKGGLNDERGIHLEPIGTTFRANGKSGWSQVNPSINTSGIWKHICWTFNQTSGTYGTDVGVLTFYENGVQKNQISNFIPAPDNGVSIRLGRRNGHLQHFFYGDLANYFFYRKTFTQQEVEQHFNAFRGRYGI